MKGWGWNAWGEIFWLWIPALLLLLYLFRPKHRQQLVAAAFLWQEVGDRLGGQSLWRRLLNQKLLWLQLLFCGLAILALMRPYQIRPGLVARQVALVVDTSASMAAGRPTRLQTVLAEARQIVRQAPTGSEFLLASLDRDLLLIQPFTKDREAVLDGLGRLQPRGLRGRDAQVSPFILSLLKGNPGTQLHWFSDHPLQHAVAVQHVADQGRVNCAIESFQAGSDSLFLAVKNYHAQAAQVPIRITGQDGFVVERICSLRGSGRQMVQIPRQGRGPYQAQLLNQDDFEVDDRGYAVELDNSNRRLLSHGRPSVFLEQAVQAASGAALVRVESPLEVPGRVLHLWDTLPENLPAGHHIAGKPPSSWVDQILEDEGSLLISPQVQGLFRFRISSQRWGSRFKLRGGIQDVTPVLVDGQGQPLLVQKGRALVWLFALESSDLPLSPELPLILSVWLQQTEKGSLAGSLLCGNRVELAGPGPILLKGPRGIETVDGHSDRLEWCPSWPGLYQVAEKTLAVNFHAPEESNLTPPARRPLASPDQAAAGLETRPMSQEYARVLIFLGLLVLLWEYRVWWGSKPRC